MITIKYVLGKINALYVAISLPLPTKSSVFALNFEIVLYVITQSRSFQIVINMETKKFVLVEVKKTIAVI